ncbi:MAG: PH domain-containing protein [Propionibacteriaceae bacterium]
MWKNLTGRGTSISDPLFSPEELAWQHISPRWITLKRIHMAMVWIIQTAIAATACFVFIPCIWAGISVILLGCGWLLWRLSRAPRLWQAWGFAERDNDLFVRSGIWWRSLTAVPYGRMQVVEINAGPIERYLGLARVKLVTAAASPIVEGLDADTAARLRERLTNLGETRSAGL